jgi:surface antigen
VNKFLGLCLLLVCLPAAAFNLGFLVNSPAYFFSNGDWSIMQETAYQALDDNADNVKSDWKNPATGAFGSVTPFRTSRINGKICRQLKIFNSARNVTGDATYLFCRINHEWKVSS